MNVIVSVPVETRKAGVAPSLARLNALSADWVSPLRTAIATVRCRATKSRRKGGEGE